MADFVLSNRDERNLIAFLKDLIRIPSPSCDEKQVAERVSAEMRAVGFHEVWIDRIGNVVGRLGPGKGPRLLLDAHMDTVGVGDRSAWTHDPFGAEIEGDLLFGRGAADMKGALASMVYGAKVLAESGLRLNGDLYLVGVVQEEPCEGCAVRAMLDDAGICPDWVVLGEPSNLQISRGHRGRAELRVTIRGKAAHASAPERGENAITHAARIIFALDLLAAGLPEDPFLGKGTLAVTQIENTAGSRNAIPDSCTLYIDRRLTLGETEPKAIAELQGIIAREGISADVSFTEYRAISYTGHECCEMLRFPAWVMPENHALVQTAAQVVRQVVGERPTIGRWNFSTDGAYTMGVAGIPTVGIGPGDEAQAHTADERIRLGDCLTAARIYAGLAAHLLR
jgi:putative selenium metabolism hydrolase